MLLRAMALLYVTVQLQPNSFNPEQHMCERGVCVGVKVIAGRCCFADNPG